VSDLAWMRPKLAELAGVKVDLSTFEQYQPSEWIERDGRRHRGHWLPDQDIGQAIMCLEAMRALGWCYRISAVPTGNIEVTLRSSCDEDFCHDSYAADLTQITCHVIAGALGWEKS
jgi:hypothetical protein